MGVMFYNSEESIQMSAKKSFAAVVLSASLVLGGSVASMATESTEVLAPVSAPAASPTPKTKPWQEYKAAMTTFKTAMDKFKGERITFDQAMQAHRTAMTAYMTAKKPINDAFKATVDAARETLKAALAAATTNEQKSAAYAAMKAVVTTATATRDAAVALLGPAPVKPVKPAKPERPTAPTKPVKPTPAPTIAPN
jgi:hypothetical protein